MKTIKITQNKQLIIDDEDFESVSKHKWSAVKKGNNFYAVSRIDGKIVSAHRFLLNINDSKILIDHIDRDGLNNQKINLRFCNKSQNGANCRPKGTSIYLGVCWNKKNKVWKSSIGFCNKNIFIGNFFDEKEAALSYNKKAIELFGEFANINKI